MSRPAFRPVRRFARLVVAAMGLAVVGCAQQRPRPAEPVSPGERAPGVGLEVVWWVVDPAPRAPATGGPPPPGMGQVLARYEVHPVPASAGVVSRWRANGLRVLAVPRSELAALRQRLNVIGPVKQQWLGETPRWVEAVRGPSWSRRLGVQMDNGQLDLSDGAARLLVRCWSAPGGTPRPEASALPGALQVEMVPQFVPPVRVTADVELTPPRLTTPQGEGLVFDRLALTASLSGDEVLVIVPESPGTLWAMPQDIPQSRGPEADEGFGPPVPPQPTLGEAMLTDVTGNNPRGNRVIVVLLPSAPKEFRLIGP